MTIDELMKTVPDIPQDTIEMFGRNLPQYLFFETIKGGVRKYKCTACGESFFEGEKVQHRTMSERDYILRSAVHKSYANCPLCGYNSQVVNMKIKTPTKYNQSEAYAVFLPVSHDEVWIRCIWLRRLFDSQGKGSVYVSSEPMRYHLAPGRSEMYEHNYYNQGYSQTKTVREAFLWVHGCYTEKYSYTTHWEPLGGIDNVDGTFLKYNSYDYYEGVRGVNLPFIKYLCWYARHPQIEMLAKMRQYEPIDEMIFRNTANVRTLDWSAKTPWGLYRLTKSDYKIFEGKYDCSLALLKIYRKIKGSGERDFEYAAKLKGIFHHWGFGKRQQTFFSTVNGLGITAEDFIKYLEKCTKAAKDARRTINTTFDTYLDYISMAKAAGGKYDPLPRDLRTAHDRLVAKKNAIAAEKRKKMLKEQAAALDVKYPLVKEVCKKIKSTYEYVGADYSVIVPRDIYDIILEGETLSHCVGSAERYYERIEQHETYILFLRKNEHPDSAWYTLEAEPDGTVRQKRTVGDCQNEDIEEATRFLREWQRVISKRINAEARERAKESRRRRGEEYAELRRIGARIRRGDLAGRLLADVLGEDLMINESEVAV